MEKNHENSFVKVPVALIKGEDYRQTDVYEILLYSLIVDRYNLSLKHRDDFTDDNGEVYVIYTLNEIMSDLRCCNHRAQKSLNNLESAGFIKIKRTGLCKPNLIYPVFHFPVCKINISGDENNSLQEMHYQHSNHTYNIHTDINQTHSFRHRYVSEQEIKERVEYDVLAEGNNKEIIDELIMTMAEMYNQSSPDIRIAGTLYSKELVTDRLDKIDSEMLMSIVWQINKNKTRVKNHRAYIRALLFNEPAVFNIGTALDFGADFH